MNSKKILSGMLSASLAMSLLILPAHAEDSFSDVSSDAWYAAAVEWAARNNVTSGDGNGNFLPNTTLNYAQAIQFIYNSKGQNTGSQSNPWYAAAQAWGIENGYIDSDTVMEDSCTRLEFVEMLYSAAGSPAVDSKSPFTDTDSQAAIWASENGIASGNTQGQFLPDSTLKRASAAQFLYNAGKINETTPPDKPDGTAPGQSNGTTPPDKPDGTNQGQSSGTTPPDKPDGTGQGQSSGTTPPDKPDGTTPGQGSGQSSGVSSYSSVNEYKENTSISGKTITSTGTDENAVLADGDCTVTLSGVTVNRTSSSSTGGDNSSFYGVGAAILATDGKLNISDSTITTNAAGGAGVFAYGDAVVNVSNTSITTKKDTSGGIHVAGGGTLNATDCTVETSGNSSAAIRSDRGGGTMTVNGGSYTSNGTGSPAVYCTADITVSDAVLNANSSEAVCIEGLNSLTLNNCTLSGNMSDDKQNDCTWNVIVYQSMSGDSKVGNGTFSMTGGKLIAKNGGMFYTTNTDSTFYLSGVDITYASENDFFLRCTGNSNSRGWGSSGSNGANCTFTAVDQVMQGDIIYDSISTLKFVMQKGSTLTGAIYDDESCAGNGGSGTCTVTIDSTSTWIVTGNSTVTSLTNNGSIVDAQGRTVSIVGTDGTTYVKGTSSFIVTVENYK